jgi:hypothetical protein
MAVMPSTNLVRGAEPPPRFEFTGGQGSAKSAQHKAQDFRPQVLDQLRPVHAYGARDVPVKASHTNAHVTGVAQLLKQCREHPDEASNYDDAGSRCE